MLAQMPRSDLGSVTQALQRIPARCTPETSTENLAFVAALGRPASALAMIDALLGDSSALRAIAGRSYRHVNHFDKIVLVDSSDPAAYRLTLHIWNPPYPETERRDELIHDHRFSFWSCVLTGELVSENFEDSTEGSRFRAYQYVPEDWVATSFYRFTGDRTLAQTSVSRKRAGESYHLGYEQIHRVQLPQTEIVCTLVLRGPRERTFSNVFNTVYPRRDASIRYDLFSERDVTSRLRALAGACRARLPRPKVTF